MVSRGYDEGFAASFAGQGDPSNLCAQTMASQPSNQLSQQAAAAAQQYVQQGNGCAMQQQPSANFFSTHAPVISGAGVGFDYTQPVGYLAPGVMDARGIDEWSSPWAQPSAQVLGTGYSTPDPAAAWLHSSRPTPGVAYGEMSVGQFAGLGPQAHVDLRMAQAYAEFNKQAGQPASTSAPHVSPAMCQPAASSRLGASVEAAARGRVGGGVFPPTPEHVQMGAGQDGAGHTSWQPVGQQDGAHAMPTSVQWPPPQMGASCGVESGGGVATSEGAARSAGNGGAGVAGGGDGVAGAAPTPQSMARRLFPAAPGSDRRACGNLFSLFSRSQPARVQPVEPPQAVPLAQVPLGSLPGAQMYPTSEHGDVASQATGISMADVKEMMEAQAAQTRDLMQGMMRGMLEIEKERKETKPPPAEAMSAIAFDLDPVGIRKFIESIKELSFKFNKAAYRIFLIDDGMVFMYLGACTQHAIPS